MKVFQGISIVYSNYQGITSGLFIYMSTHHIIYPDPYKGT